MRADELARTLRSSRSSVYAALRAGEIPTPIKTCGMTGWRRAEIERWVLDGCPHVAAQGWKWNAVRVVTLEQYLGVLRRQIEDAHREMQDIQRRIDAGERAIEVAAPAAR